MAQLAILEQLREVARGRYQAVEAHLRPGLKVIGWMCTYTPEEVIHAAGLYPVRVVGGQTPISHADAYLHINMCSLVRSCLEEAFLGHYHFLDGFVTLNTCDNVRRLYDVWGHYIQPPFSHILSLPHKVTEASIGYFKDELLRLRAHLEQHFGQAITEARLQESIAVYNHMRAHLQELDQMRQGPTPRLTGAEFLDVVLAGMFLPKEEYNDMLAQLLRELGSQPTPPANGKLRLLVVGSELDDSGLVSLLEEREAIVVADDLCTGSKYFWNLVDTNGDPWEALARRYLSRPACPRMRPSDQRRQHLRELVASRKVDGVVIEIIKFCKLHDEGSLALRQTLEEMGIPHLTLSREYSLTGAGQLTTRVEAFLERLSGL